MDSALPPRSPRTNDALDAGELFDIALREIDRHQKLPWRPVCLHCTRTHCPYLERAREFVRTIRLIVAEKNADRAEAS